MESDYERKRLDCLNSKDSAARSAENKKRMESNPSDNHGQAIQEAKWPCTVKCNNYKRGCPSEERLQICSRCSKHAKSPIWESARQVVVLSTFSALLDVATSTLDTSYAVELANGRISEMNIILRGCTLGLLGHPFDINLMPVELGSFDVIIGMDWMAKNHAMIVYDEKTQKYIENGCQVYLAQVMSKKEEDKSKEKRL
ncbi:putative reverse transcriptase domain-containing protein [Tanacetum coccineum]